MANTTNDPLDELCINTIRTLSMDAVQQPSSGHPGTPMGAAAMAYTLWTRFLRHNPATRTGRTTTVSCSARRRADRPSSC